MKRLPGLVRCVVFVDSALPGCGLLRMSAARLQLRIALNMKSKAVVEIM